MLGYLQKGIELIEVHRRGQERLKVSYPEFGRILRISVLEEAFGQSGLTNNACECTGFQLTVIRHRNGGRCSLGSLLQDHVTSALSYENKTVLFENCAHLLG